MMKKRIVTFVLLFLVMSDIAMGQNDTVKELLHKVDYLFRSKSCEANIEMKITTKHWERTLNMDVWTSGLDKTFIKINSPRKDAGTKTLRIDKSMWNYFPKINKVIKIPPSMMMGAWMGSDFTNDDMVKEETLIKGYNHQLLKNNDKEKYYILLTPKAQTVTVWGKIELIIRKKDKMPIKQTFFNEKGDEVRTMEFKEIKKLGGKTIPTKLVLTPLAKKGQQTIVTYKNAKFDFAINESIFSRQNLQKRR